MHDRTSFEDDLSSDNARFSEDFDVERFLKSVQELDTGSDRLRVLHCRGLEPPADDAAARATAS